MQWRTKSMQMLATRVDFSCFGFWGIFSQLKHWLDTRLWQMYVKMQYVAIVVQVGEFSVCCRDDGCFHLFLSIGTSQSYWATASRHFIPKIRQITYQSVSFLSKKGKNSIMSKPGILSQAWYLPCWDVLYYAISCHDVPLHKIHPYVYSPGSLLYMLSSFAFWELSPKLAYPCQSNRFSLFLRAWAPLSLLNDKVSPLPEHLNSILKNWGTFRFQKQPFLTIQHDCCLSSTA